MSTVAQSLDSESTRIEGEHDGVTVSSDITVDLVSSEASDDRVVKAARVSTVGDASEVENKGADYRSGLINYLMKDRHGSPFEHTHMTFLVKAPIFTVRHLMRHRTWSFNEESARYREIDPEFYVPDRDRKLIQTGKPGKYEYRSAAGHVHDTVEREAVEVFSRSYRAYRNLLRSGVSREIARIVLPVSTYSSVYATCNARALMHFLSLRTSHSDSAYASYPQAEIESVATQMEAVFQRLMPLTHAAFAAYRRVSP